MSTSKALAARTRTPKPVLRRPILIAPALKATLHGHFPQCLDGAPMLIQGAGSAMRRRLDGWLADLGVRPLRVGEFDDAALLKAFGSEGRGVFMAPTVLERPVFATVTME